MLERLKRNTLALAAALLLVGIMGQVVAQVIDQPPQQPAASAPASPPAEITKWSVAAQALILLGVLASLGFQAWRTHREDVRAATQRQWTIEDREALEKKVREEAAAAAARQESIAVGLAAQNVLNTQKLWEQAHSHTRRVEEAIAENTDINLKALDAANNFHVKLEQVKADQAKRDDAQDDTQREQDDKDATT